jgi:hypothetical protein
VITHCDIFEGITDIFLKQGPVPHTWPAPLSEILADPTIKVITQDDTTLSTYNFANINFPASSLMIMVQGTNYLIFNEFEVYGTFVSQIFFNFH